MVKQKCFIQPDGISITLNEDPVCKLEENFNFPSLFVYKSCNFKPQKRCLFLLFLLVCGDIETQPGPYRSIPELETLCSRRELKICHINIRGLQGKFDEISNLLTHYKIDILTLNELFINNTKSKFDIPRFTFLRKDRHAGTGGGVGMFIRNELDFQRKQTFENKEIESIFVEIYQKKSKPFTIGTIYRPPDSSKYLSKDFDTTLSNKLKDMENLNEEIIILGDLNVDYLKNDHKAIKYTFEKKKINS